MKKCSKGLALTSELLSSRKEAFRPHTAFSSWPCNLKQNYLKLNLSTQWSVQNLPTLLQTHISNMLCWKTICTTYVVLSILLLWVWKSALTENGFQKSSEMDQDTEIHRRILLIDGKPLSVGPRPPHEPSTTETADNKWVAPYFTRLPVMFRCFLNVDLCVLRVGGTKYLFKYYYKGSDRFMAQIYERATLLWDRPIPTSAECSSIRSFLVRFSILNHW